MPFYDLGCPACQAEYVDVWMGVSDTRECGCGVTFDRLWRTRSVIGDECDLMQENGFAHPTRFTSKRELQKALDARGLEMRVRHVPIPGTDKSPHTTDWSKGSMDPYTLAAAEALVARAGTVSTTTETPTIASTWTVTVRE